MSVSAWAGNRSKKYPIMNKKPGKAKALPGFLFTF